MVSCALEPPPENVGEIQELQHPIHRIFVGGSRVPELLRYMPPLGVDRRWRIIGSAPTEMASPGWFQPLFSYTCKQKTVINEKKSGRAFGTVIQLQFFCEAMRTLEQAVHDVRYLHLHEKRFSGHCSGTELT